jgi:alkaline phosphatase
MRRALAMGLIGLLAAGPSFAQPPNQANDSYFKQGRAELQQRLKLRPNTGRAKNVILFVGDGTGVSTITAGRIYTGQARGLDGESYQLAIDQLPYAALVKTYTHDSQVADSAPTATALMAGVKTRNQVIGVDQTVPGGDCAASKGHEVMSLIEMAEASGLATGVVTTTQVTHATPAAAYAHVADRDWEDDTQLTPEAKAAGCIDIARQLVGFSHGDGPEVVFGGGRAFFTTTAQVDPEIANRRGNREDGRDLIAEWKTRYPAGVYAWNRQGFDAMDPKAPGPLLGLFSPGHMSYELDRPRDPGQEPSLAEMTRKAIEKLSRDKDGFVLLVEGGRIDHANHANNAAKALSDLAALDEAVKVALSMTNPKDTLVIVTADHSHGLTISGYPVRNNPILDVVRNGAGQVVLRDDGKAYTTLGYATGPGAATGARRDPATENTRDPNYKQSAVVPVDSASHGGEDVEVKAIGPWAHLLEGTIEQNTIFHVMAHALGPRLKPRR